jgi:uncharacterized Fe-S radical SAM superfamily protein PflX
MAQYHSANKSNNFKELSRSLNREEYEQAVNHLEKFRLKKRLDTIFKS